MTNLMDVRPGRKAVVAGIAGSGALRRRMLDMGIVPGVELEVVRQARVFDTCDLYRNLYKP